MALQLESTSVGIARCLREMGSAELGHIFAGAVALKRFLAARGKTFEDLAQCIEGWARYEQVLAEQVAAVDASGGLFEQALTAQYEADNAGSDGDWINPATNTQSESEGNRG